MADLPRIESLDPAFDRYLRPDSEFDEIISGTVFSEGPVWVPDGNYLLVPEIEVNTYWTNLPCEAQEVIGLYHDHGTSEQFHSELKSDLDIERLPSGKLCVNKIILLCGMLAFNLLRGLGQEVIRRAALAPQKITVSRWRLKTVLQNIIYCAVRIVRHAGRIELHYGKRCPWFDIIADIARSRA